MTKPDIAVIGGGPAGMIAAIQAAYAGARVTLLEKKDKVGRKLLVTGRGRCNLSNKYMGPDHYHCGKRDFVNEVFKAADPAEVLDYLTEAGIYLKSDETGRIFPYSEEASAVLDILRMEMQRAGVEERCSFPVRSLEKSGRFFAIRGENDMLEATRVILATGGRSYPKLGAEGDGYRLAEKLGHNIVPPFPALVHLRCDAPFLKRISGIKFDGIAKLRVNKQTVKRYGGEILFTDYGLSGIPILQLSRRVNEALQHHQKPVIYLDLFPSYKARNLNFILKKRVYDRPERSIADVLKGFLNKKLIPVVLAESGMQHNNVPANQLKDEVLQKLIRFLKSWAFVPTETRGWDVAQVTAGGINVCEVAPKHLKSRVVPGLYFAGEVLDVDGESGGYNLQWAWTSGYLAGRSATKSFGRKT